MPPATELNAAGPMMTAHLVVEQMMCAACVRRIERALLRLPGVKEATASFATHMTRVVYDADAVGPPRFASALADAGYGVAGAIASPTARAMAAAEAEDREHRSLRRNATMAVALTAPLLGLAVVGSRDPAFDGATLRWLQLLLATAVVFGPGRRFLRAAVAALRYRLADMNTLVGTAVLAAWGYSAIAVAAPGTLADAGGAPRLYVEAAATIVSFVLLGKLLEARARRRLSEAVRGLISLLPRTARRLRDGDDEEIAIEDLAVGDLILVRPGERVPADGEIVRGASAVDESMLTGESAPVAKQSGASLLGGTLNQHGALTFRVTRAGAGTALARIIEAVEQVQSSRAPIARMADVVSGYFAPAVFLVALVTFGIWLAIEPGSAGLAMAVERSVAVLVVACPCALGLATPAAVAVASGRAAELGILIKGGAALEAASRIDTLLLDKTGTVTDRTPALTDVIDRSGRGALELLAVVASLERESEHPMARAIVAAAIGRGARLRDADRIEAVPGAGLQGTVEGQRVQIGTSRWLAAGGIATAPLDAAAGELAAAGRTVSFVAIEGRLAGLIALADRPAADSARVVAELLSAGIEVAMVTGDRGRPARAVADAIGIRTVLAEVEAGGKAALVAWQRERGRTVAMVGDGINDALALATADVGIAVGSGTDLAVAAAEISLLRGGIGALPRALRLARATLRTIRQNLLWAVGYNVVGIPLAAGAFHPLLGWQLSPVLASAAMSLSSVAVLLSSLRLRRFERSEDDHAVSPGAVRTGSSRGPGPSLDIEDLVRYQ
jgi:P-type Cu+ transporter